jgi:hypothetical protein
MKMVSRTGIKLSELFRREQRRTAEGVHSLARGQTAPLDALEVVAYPAIVLRQRDRHVRGASTTAEHDHVIGPIGLACAARRAVGGSQLGQPLLGQAVVLQIEDTKQTKALALAA